MKIPRAVVKALFGLKLRLDLYEEVRDFLADGIPLVGCLRELHDNAATRKELEFIVLREVLRDMLKKLEAGRQLSDFMGRWIPQEELQLLAAGETTGQLHTGFKEAAEIAAQRAEMRGALAKALAYPVVLVFALIGFIGYFGYVLIPELTKFLKPEEWKGSTKTFYEIVHFSTTFALPLSVVLIGALVVAWWSLPRWTGPMRRYADKVVPWSMYRTYNSSTFLIALAAMLRAGVPFDSSVKQLAMSANPWMRYHLARVTSRLRQGWQPEAAMDTGLFEDKVAFRIRARGKLSSFEQAIESIGHRATGYAMRRMIAMSASVSFVVIFLVAGMAFWGYYTGTEVASQAAEKAKRSTGSYR